jgi:hypothetical protein
MFHYSNNNQSGGNSSASDACEVARPQASVTAAQSVIARAIISSNRRCAGNVEDKEDHL